MIKDDDSDAGFVDVAANALAIIILMTMIALIIAAIPATRGEVRAEARPALPFPVALDPSVRPFNSYWFVSEAGLTRIDLGEAAIRFAGGETVVETDLGRFYMQTWREGYRDPSEYRVDFLPFAAGIALHAQPLDASSEVAAVVAFDTAFREARIVPTFLVARDGYATFTALYNDLRALDIPLRWHAVDAGQQLSFVRNVQQFESLEARWR